MKKPYIFFIAIVAVLFLAITSYAFLNGDGSENTKQNESNTQNSDKQVKGVSTQTDEPIIKKVNSKEALEIINNNSALIIIDLRTYEEYDRGHIENAVNIDYYGTGFEDKIKSLEKNLPYLIYCQSGNRSSQALKMFKEQHIIEVYELIGGYSEWNKV